MHKKSVALSDDTGTTPSILLARYMERPFSADKLRSPHFRKELSLGIIER